jgi:hypothetical protein
MLCAPEVAMTIFVAFELGILFVGIASRFKVELSVPEDSRHDAVGLVQVKINLMHGKSQARQAVVDGYHTARPNAQIWDLTQYPANDRARTETRDGAARDAKTALRWRCPQTLDFFSRKDTRTICSEFVFCVDCILSKLVAEAPIHKLGSRPG